MTSVGSLFTDADLQRINQAVAQAEARTAAEIVPVVAASSGRYDRPEDMVGLWLGLLALIAVFLLYPRGEVEPGSWAEPSLLVQGLVLVGTFLAGFVAGAVIASRVGWLRRLFTPRRQMLDEVAMRARVVFFDSRVHRTTGGTGILLYVSLFEHMAHVLADQTILDKLGQAGLDQLCANLVSRLRQHGPAEALCQTISECGDRLGPLLPRAASAENQLPNALVMLD